MGGWYDSLHRRDTNHTFDAWLIDGFLGNFLRLFAKEYRWPHSGTPSDRLGHPLSNGIILLSV